MTAADKRVSALLDRWAASIEQHREYTRLTDEVYWTKRSWPPHRRPATEVLDIAAKRLLKLQRELVLRNKSGDKKFAELLELMSVMTSMVARESIERFIPIVEPDKKIEKIAKSGIHKPERRDFVRRQELIRLIVSDAVRLMSWGRQWHTLGEDIAKIQNRPPSEIIKRVLKANRGHIEKQAITEKV